MMEALTPASADDLPPLGVLIADDPFWRYRAGELVREGVAHLRVWTTVAIPPGHLAVVTETARPPQSPSPPGTSGASSPARTGGRSCCSNTTSRPKPEKARRFSTWSASAPTAARSPRTADTISPRPPPQRDFLICTAFA
jgi:hypothetical protein